jgi:hypothetical protein
MVFESLSLRRIWQMTRANTLRLTLATVLCILPGFLPPFQRLGGHGPAPERTKLSMLSAS